MKRLIVPAFLALAAASAVLAQSSDIPATIVVRLPADAKLVIGSQQTEQRGSERRFVSPALVPGYTYSYQLNASWTTGGKEVKIERSIEFKPGQVTVIDLRKQAVQVAETKQLPKKTVVKEEPKKVEVVAQPKKKEVKVVPSKPAVKVEPKATTGDEAGFVALFNGKDLTGWKTITSGKDDGNTFTVKDGAVVVRGNPAGYFYTDKSYHNYVLRFEWKFIKDGNSGLLMHIQGKHQIWPKSVEVQGMQRDHGHIFAIGGAKGQFKTDRDNQKKAIKIGEWNTTEIVAKDGAITSTINGLPISTGSADIVEGPFGFQSEGVELHFRNIRIKTLPVSAPAPHPKATEDAPKKVQVVPAKKQIVTAKVAGGDGFKELFNGKNLDGWKTFLDPKAKDADPAKSFIVKDGEIQVPGFPNGYFYTDKSYKNYVLRYDWTYPKNQPEKTTMNSGCLVHMQLPHKIWPKSVEPQGRYKDHGKLFFIGFGKESKTEQMFDEVAHQKALKASDEWNSTELTCKGDGSITVRINGVLVNQGKSELTEGPIGFQSEAARIHFRNIKIKMLD